MPGWSTFQTEYELLQGFSGDDSAGNLDRMKAFVNQAYHWLELSADWSWLLYTGFLTTKARYYTGTISVTEGLTTLAGSGTTWDAGWTNRKIITESGEVYGVTFSGAGAGTLDRAAVKTETGVTYVVFQDVYPLASRMRSVSHLWVPGQPYPIRIVRPEVLSHAKSGGYVYRIPEVAALVEVDSDLVPQVEFWPVPDAAGSVAYRGRRRLADLANPGDTLQIPSSLADCFRNKALSILWHFRNDGRRAEAEATANSLLASAINMDPTDEDRGDQVLLDPKVFYDSYTDRNWPPRAGIG